MPAFGQSRPQLAVVRPDVPDMPTVAPLPIRVAGERAASGIAARTIDLYRDSLTTVDPLFPPRYLPLLLTLAAIDPTFSQAVKLLEASANRGHSVVINTDDQALLALADARLAALTGRLTEAAGGLDSLINTHVAQLAVTGAISSEVVLQPSRTGVQVLELVPVQDIQFKRGDGRWYPLQRTGRGLIELDPRTYTYAAWRTFENNPYAVPPMLAAINAWFRENDMLEQLDAILRKAGFLGLLAVTMDPGQQPEMMDPDEWLREKRTRLQEIIDGLALNFRKGIVAVEKGVEFQFQGSPAGQISGARELFELNEAMKFSGLGIDPSLFGRSWAKTETWRDAAGNLLTTMASAAQRLTASRLESMLRLDFALGGVSVDTWIAFEPAPGARPQEDATAQATRWATIKNQVITGALDADAAMKELGYDRWFDKSRLPVSEGIESQSNWSFVKECVREGLLTPDEGAKMLGFPSWADPSRVSNPNADPTAGAGMLGFSAEPAIFEFDKSRGRHVYRRRHLGSVDTSELQGKRGVVVAALERVRGGKKRSSLAKGPGARALMRMVGRFVARYATKVGPVLGRLQFDILEDLKAAVLSAPEGTWSSEDEFGRWALNEMQQSFARHWADYGEDDFYSNVLATHEEMAQAWRDEQRKRLVGKELPQELGQASTDAIKALAQNDTFHMSIYLEGLQGDERKAMENMIAEQFLAAGKDVYDPDVMDELMTRLERSGGLPLRRRDHGREGGFASETEDQARERMSSRLGRIVETTVMRSRNTAEIYGLEDGAFETFVIVRDQSSEAEPGEICVDMDGRTFSVETAANAMREFHAMTPEQQEAALTGMRDIAAAERDRLPMGQVPPFHPNCRCVLDTED